jgi:chromatin licensing and DNA replication factor 1
LVNGFRWFSNKGYMIIVRIICELSTVRVFEAKMAQPSVAQYFNTRKRSAVDDHKIESARKVLVLDHDVSSQANSTLKSNKITIVEQHNVPKKVAKTKKVKGGTNQDIKNFLDNMKKFERCVTPPNQCEKEVNNEITKIKEKLCRSSKLNELKESINRFKESATQLKAVEKTVAASLSPKLKTFKSLEFEISVSPQKTLSPEKPYLSPKKESSVRRNLLNALSPIKNCSGLVLDSYTADIIDGTSKPSLKLPYKYKILSEIFRAIDTVAQILFNRKEIITFKKLKPAVEELLKKTLLPKHLAQIKTIYPTAYDYKQEKVKVFGTGQRQGEWDLTLIPHVDNADGMTSQILLNRRRTFYEILIDKIKDYHNEFLSSLIPPMTIPKDSITRWHPEFDIERVPDIECSDLPQVPVEEKFTSGKDVLEKARQMFNCNTRMEQALAKLKEARERIPVTEEETTLPATSILKGIPKALLEKVRQKQAAKALVSMTRTVDKEKEVQMYSRLPEIARLARSLFVSEKKGVLELDIVVEKLGNSYRCSLNKTEMEQHLLAISKEVPGWLVFHKLRSSVFLKLAKNADLSVVLNKLEKVANERREL